MKKSDELRQKKADLVAQARAIPAKAETEKRDMTVEELAQFNKIMDVSLIEVDGQIKTEEAGELRMKSLESAEAWLKESQGRRSAPNPVGGGTAPTEFRYKAGTKERVIKLHTNARAGSEAYRSAFSRALVTRDLTGDEQRALQADNDASGGFLVGPQMFVAQLIAIVDNLCYIRRMANVLPPLLKSESVGIPTRSADIADSDWTAELLTGNEDSTLAFGKRELRPHAMAKRIKVSKKLIRSSALDPEAIILERMAYKAAITEEQGYLTGTGVDQALGVFIASGSGISTSRDLSTGNTTSQIVADNLIAQKYNLKQPYWDKASWIFHRDAMKQIAQLKDGIGQYLWRTGLVSTEPDTILGRPVNISEYAPNTFTTGLYVGLLGDFSHYMIADSLDFQIQILLELYAETNQNGYVMRKETDGAPVLEEAFSRVKLG